MKIKFFFLIALVSVQSWAQSPTVEWYKPLAGTADDEAKSIQQTADGGYIVAGNTKATSGYVTGNHGMSDYWVVKLDTLGNIVWQKCLGGSANDVAYSIDQTSDGGFIVAGYSDSNNGDVTGNHGSSDCWIVKLDATGNIIWQKSLGGSDSDLALSIQQTNDGGYILTGKANSINGDVTANNGTKNIWVVKLNDLGSLVWEKSLSGNNANSIKQTSDNGYILGGSTNYTQSGAWTQGYGILYKLDSDGNISMFSYAGYRIHSVLQAADGNYVLAGQQSNEYADVSFVGSKSFVAKIGQTGSSIWHKTFGISGLTVSVNYSVQQMSDGGYIAAGRFTNSSAPWERMYRLDDEGNLLWQQTTNSVPFYGHYSEIQATADGGFVTAGDVYGITKFGTETLSSSAFETEKHSKIYPNPTQDVVTVIANSTYKAISIFDISGKALFQENNKIDNISLSDYEKGIYFLSIQFDNGKTETHKIIKK